MHLILKIFYKNEISLISKRYRCDITQGKLLSIDLKFVIYFYIFLPIISEAQYSKVQPCYHNLYSFVLQRSSTVSHKRSHAIISQLDSHEYINRFLFLYILFHIINFFSFLVPVEFINILYIYIIQIVIYVYKTMFCFSTSLGLESSLKELMMHRFILFLYSVSIFSVCRLVKYLSFCFEATFPYASADSPQ